MQVKEHGNILKAIQSMLSVIDRVKSTSVPMTKRLYNSLKSSEKEFSQILNTTYCAVWRGTRPLPACLER